MEFSRPEYRSGSPFPFPGDLPNPGIKPSSPALQVDSLPAEPPGNHKVGTLKSKDGGKCLFGNGSGLSLVFKLPSKESMNYPKSFL